MINCRCHSCKLNAMSMVTLSPGQLVVECAHCGAKSFYAIPPTFEKPALSRMAEAFKKFSDATIAMIDSKTVYDTGKGGNFADRMTSPVGWLHDASKYLHEVYQHTLGDTKMTKDEAKRNLYKAAHCCQLAADRLYASPSSYY